MQTTKTGMSVTGFAVPVLTTTKYQTSGMVRVRSKVTPHAATSRLLVFRVTRTQRVTIVSAMRAKRRVGRARITDGLYGIGVVGLRRGRTERAKKNREWGEDG